MFTQDPFGFRAAEVDLMWAYLPAETDRSERDDERNAFEDWVDAAQDT